MLLLRIATIPIHDEGDMLRAGRERGRTGRKRDRTHGLNSISLISIPIAVALAVAIAIALPPAGGIAIVIAIVPFS